MSDLLQVNGLRIKGIEADIDLALDAGSVLGITGPSGVGKTLLLRAIADLDDHAGHCRLSGEDSAQMPAYEWRRKVALLPAESAWWFDTVGEHFYKENRELLSVLGFGIEVMDWQVSRLSSGERQRLSLLRLLQNDPRVLLLDEPTANLDPENIQRVERYLVTYIRTSGAAALWVSHSREQLSRVANRVCTLNTGGISCN